MSFKTKMYFSANHLWDVKQQQTINHYPFTLWEIFTWRSQRAGTFCRTELCSSGTMHLDPAVTRYQLFKHGGITRMDTLIATYKYKYTLRLNKLLKVIVRFQINGSGSTSPNNSKGLCMQYFHHNNRNQVISCWAFNLIVFLFRFS